MTVEEISGKAPKFNVLMYADKNNAYISSLEEVMYKEIAGIVVDLSYHKVDIFDTTLTLSECIDLMIEKCKMAIKEVDSFEYTKHMDTVWTIMKEVHGLLWW